MLAEPQGCASCLSVYMASCLPVILVVSEALWRNIGCTCTFLQARAQSGVPMATVLHAVHGLSATRHPSQKVLLFGGRKGSINSLLIPRKIHQESGLGKRGSQGSRSVCSHHLGCKPAHPGESCRQDLLRHLATPAQALFAFVSADLRVFRGCIQ